MNRNIDDEFYCNSNELPKSSLLLNMIALHCIGFYCIALYCIALHCIALHCIALHCIALHCIALHCIAPFLPNCFDSTGLCNIIERMADEL